RLVTDTLTVPTLGVFTQADSAGAHVTQLVPGGVAARAGVQPGDVLLSVGEVRTQTSDDFGAEFRARYAGRAGAPLPIVVRRGGRTLTLDARVELTQQVVQSLGVDPRASAKAARIRAGIFHGQ
ncbi:MAG TPA: PDZ domain-containing protein, partial [Gemmatimonadaceae bacterium]|nr:PDZ domain-containing protein [Gemmatimonadaceae bacterium]